MKFEINTDKIVENVVSEALEREIDGKTIKQWMTEIAKHQWISVKDRLPVRPPDVCGLLVRRQWYLVALESGAVLTLSYEFDEDRWQGVGSPVTHWMPLPEPPEEDDVK